MVSPSPHDSDSVLPYAGESTVEFEFSDAPVGSVERLQAETLHDMATAWRQGQRRLAESWLAERPLLADRSDLAVRVIYEEVCLREERGERVESDEIYRRFPQWRRSLEVLFDCHRMIEQSAATTVFPVAGQRLGDFQLLRELGRGAVGRVFLATQAALSDRPVVVKLTAQGDEEHLSLARVQHTHIVPLYLVHDFPEENLRALCMPYLGGASWAQVLDAMRDRAPQQRTGRQIVEALEACQSGFPAGPKFSGPALAFLNRATYVQAVCWIGACLADALQYAHQRGLVHLDIKPSNVLLAGDGQPMLLDFHLAREIVPRGGGPLDRLGGTPGYMSREQLLATEAVREGKTLSMALDGRSDLYSLGALLYESLGGALPSPDPTVPRRLRQLNPQVSRSLDDLVYKCLARDPAARYGEAADVAADLRRHLADLPLHGVANRSLAERWQKWRRRKPQAFALMTAGVLVLSALGTGGAVFYEQRLREARSALEQGQQNIASHDYGGAIERLQAGLDSVGWLVGQYDLKQSLRSKLALAQSARLSDTLHELVERLRFVDIFAFVSTTKLRQLDTGCARVWDARNQIAGNDSSKGNPEVERQLRTDLIDLALLWADLRVRLAPDDEVGTAHRDALRLLDEAQALCGSSAVLEMARREHELAAGVPQRAVGPASPLAPKTAWEYFAFGRSLFRADHLSEAQQQFRHALDLEPDAFWPNFYLTLSAYRLEHFEEALNAASVCVALSPQSAECFYNRALSHQALGHADEALHDFARALSLDPTLAVAALQRGKLLAQQQHYADALVDLRTALAQGANPAEVWYETAQVHLARQDSTAALKSLEQSLLSDPEYPPALALRSKLDARP